MRHLRAVTANLGCGGPHPPERVDAAHRWATAIRAEGHDLVFVQEMPCDHWVDEWRDGYHVITMSQPRYRVRSALLVATELQCRAASFPTAKYHDSYVAAAVVRLPNQREFTCLSVHASSGVVSPEWRAQWEACRSPLPPARQGEELWDADLLLASVLAIARTSSLLVAGDWNEARDWDNTHSGTAGAQFFDCVAAGGLVDCTYRDWKCELPTWFPERGPALQVDHIFATADMAASVNVPRIASERLDTYGSDHQPIVVAGSILTLYRRSKTDPPVVGSTTWCVGDRSLS